VAEHTTRDRILQAALDEFGTHGYHATSVREIAERVGVTKTAVLYHFPGKADILAALAEPLFADLNDAMTAVDRWVLIEGILDVWLKHRYLLRISLLDLGLAAEGKTFARWRDTMLEATALVAGPHPDLTARVRAAQAIGMLADPVVLFADAPTGALRAAVLDGVHRLLGESGPRLKNSATRGRPSVVSPAMVERAQRMHRDGSTAAEIAAALGISRATVYRHLPDH
jgi:AcrR family transcriptional regulator